MKVLVKDLRKIGRPGIPHDRDTGTPSSRRDGVTWRPGALRRRPPALLVRPTAGIRSLRGGWELELAREAVWRVEARVGYLVGSTRKEPAFVYQRAPDSGVNAPSR